VSVSTQRSLAGGELSPSLAARADTIKYATGLKTMRNAWVRSDGGSQNRPGTQYIATVPGRGRLIPFEFNSDQTYILEFTDLLLRVFKSGVLQGVSFVSPYAVADLPEVRFSQSADVVTFTCAGYPAYELTRTSDTSWSFAQTFFGADLVGLVVVPLTAGAAGSRTNRYVLTGVLESGEETTPLVLNSKYSISSIGVYAPGQTRIICTATPSDIVQGDLIFVNNVVGTVEMNGRYFTVIGQLGDAVILNVDSDNFTAYVSGGQIGLCSVADTSAVNPPTSANPDVLLNVGPATFYDLIDNNPIPYPNDAIAVAMNVYMEENGIYGFIGTSANGTFRNTGITPDITINPPGLTAFYDLDVETPSCCAYIQQRRAFGDFANDSEKVVLSATGRYHSFQKLNPTVDSDPVVFRMAGKKVSQVKHIVDVGALVLFTSTGEFVALGNAAGFVTPGEVNLKQQSAFGSNHIAPIIMDGAAIFIQARGSYIREIAFDVNTAGFRGSDLTAFAKHLVEDNTLMDWAYQLNPHSIVWVVRDDGILLGMTYVKEHQILAFHHHDLSGGFVENVCVVPEGDEDKLYLIVRREIDGETVRYLERLHERYVDPDAIEDSVFVDSSLTYDGWNDTATTMTLSGGTDWLYSEVLTLTASASYFSAGDVGNEIHLVGADGSLIRFSIDTYSSATVVTGHAHKTVPASLRATATLEWAEAVDEVGGLEHLEGEDLSVFADGFVVASPNNSSYAVRTVTDGVLSLGRCYAKIHAGLPITSDIETLDIDSSAGNLVDKNKIVSAVTVYLEKSRGGFFGPKNPDTNTRNEDDDPLFGLIEMKPRNVEGYDDPAALKTGPVEIAILPEWNSNGRVFIRQTDPLPMSLVAVAPTGMITTVRGA